MYPAIIINIFRQIQSRFQFINTHHKNFNFLVKMFKSVILEKIKLSSENFQSEYP